MHHYTVLFVHIQNARTAQGSPVRRLASTLGVKMCIRDRIHTSMEIKGICKRYRRAPYPVRRSIRLGFVCQIGLYLTAWLYALLAMPETRQP